MKKPSPLMKMCWVLGGIFVVGVGLVAAMTHSSAPKIRTKQAPNTISDNATADTPVETLKTLTASVTHVEAENEALTEDNARLKNEKAEQRQHFQQLLNKKIDTLQQHLTEQQQQTAALVGQLHQSDTRHHDLLPVDANHSLKSLQWVGDLSSTTALDASDSTLQNKSSTLNVDHLASLLHPKAGEKTDLDQAGRYQDSRRNTHSLSSLQAVKPAFTIPVNATLTGAVAMQPLIGRIPIDGTVPNPYHFKVIIGQRNIAANGVAMPDDLQGIVATGVASGDMLGSCVRGAITSMTFIFQDGHISTTQSKNNEPLGEIASNKGNPCLQGSFHTNAAMVFAGTSVLAGLEGYGNALTQAQVTNQSIAGLPTFSTLIKNGNTYAMGQAGSKAADAAQDWWNRRVKNSFDYVFVPNYNVKTHQLLTMNINITKQIDINYNPQGRKIRYENTFNEYNENNDETNTELA